MGGFSLCYLFLLFPSLKKNRHGWLRTVFSLFLKVEDRMALFSLEAINEDLPAVPLFFQEFQSGPTLATKYK